MAHRARTKAGWLGESERQWDEVLRRNTLLNLARAHSDALNGFTPPVIKFTQTGISTRYLLLAAEFG